MSGAWEKGALTSQIRRSSTSIGATLPRGGNNEFQRYLQIASGSAGELDYPLSCSRATGLSSGCRVPGDHKGLTGAGKNAYFSSKQGRRRASDGQMLGAKC
ncbi:MAG: hypothetical protein DMG70_16950 [Acidobacteria bacterium]|nr:MAG: hypothetical protein DMG70_16950 [Acidobacteriota bacterium]PYY12780.1 MAG: hypothetical protein DMG69_00150 [Acidobacteriota bacterium]